MFRQVLTVIFPFAESNSCLDLTQVSSSLKAHVPKTLM